MKKNLEIIEFENKATNTEPPKMYVRFKTSEGWMSCFDSVASDKLKQLVGSCASVEVVESKSGDKVFHNIQKCYGNAVSEDEVEIVKPGVPQETKVSKNDEIQVVVYTSYAKDLFCEIWPFYKENLEVTETECMQHAIKLVKQAKEAFE